MNRQTTPGLSIIIPVLDEGTNIAGTLQALEPLSQLGVEIIVCDGGSSDHTLKQLVDFPLVRLVVGDRGRAAQMNAGAVVARGEVLLFVHGDTRLPVSAAGQLQRFIKSGCEWGRFNVRLSGSRPLFRLVSFMINWRSRLSAICTGDQALFIRRSVFEQLGGFALQPLMEDVELSHRLKRRSRPYVITDPVVTDSRRWQQHGAWKTIWLMWQLRFLYWRGVSPDRLIERYSPSIQHEQRIDTLVIQFCKWPEAGKVKTRLAATMGNTRALQIHCELAEAVLQQLSEAVAATPGQQAFQLWLDQVVEVDGSAAGLPLVQRCIDRQIPIRGQQGSDLGERMFNALHQGLKQAKKVIIVGSDCPTVTADYLAGAVFELAHHDLVLGPSDDGGYVLIGVTRIDAELFKGVKWGSAEVLQQTLDNAGVLAYSSRCLEPAWDVDVEADYLKWQQLSLSGAK